MKLCTKRNTHKRHHSNTSHTMPKRSADSTEARKRRKLSADEVLEEAVRNGDTAAVRATLEKLPPDSKTVACLILAARNGHTETVRYLVDLPEVDVSHCDSNNESALHCAAYFGHTETVRYLVGLPEVDVDLRNNANCTALQCAADGGHADVVQVLIDAGADVDTNRAWYSPLHFASCSGALEVVKMLVKAGAGVNVTEDGNTSLILAAYCGHTETVRYLVCLPEVDVNHRNNDNETALRRAADEGKTDVVQVLIDAGADIDTKNEDGSSPLHMASRSGALKVVKMLVKAGARVNATDDFGDTCLILAAYSGHTETVRYLVGLPEVDVNHRNNNNKTALRCAADEGKTDVVQVLIDAGADIDTDNNDGRSP